MILLQIEKYLIENRLLNFIDNLNCSLIITTGGTGPSLEMLL